jgi:hypothetical protein
LEQAKADGDERLINIITRDLECLRAEMLNRVLRAETLNQILRRKATDASLPTNLLALFGLYAIWKALCGKSRFDMPAGSGYKAAMELKSSMGMDSGIEVKKPNHLCPRCGRPNYYKKSEGSHPFCSEECAVKAATPKK